MSEDLYNMIFKRKSFHLFKDVIPLQESELREIQGYFKEIKSLMPEIKVEIRLVPKKETSCKKGEYCILFYSEYVDGFLQNVGYMGEQLDLWLASKNIGVCWYGLGKTPEKQYNKLDFVIMLAIGKTHEQCFRKDYLKVKRRANEEISSGFASSVVPDMLNVVKFAPSACNSQPWFLEFQNETIHLHRIRGKTGIVPLDKMAIINQVDMGIMALFLELYLQYHKITYTREIFCRTLQEQNKVLSPQEKQCQFQYILQQNSL